MRRFRLRPVSRRDALMLAEATPDEVRAQDPNAPVVWTDADARGGIVMVLAILAIVGGVTMLARCAPQLLGAHEPVTVAHDDPNA